MYYITILARWPVASPWPMAATASIKTYRRFGSPAGAWPLHHHQDAALGAEISKADVPGQVQLPSHI